MLNKRIKTSKTTITVNNSDVGESIERKIERAIQNKEPLESEAPLIFTEKAEGVNAGYNIRTDRFEVALDGIDKIQKSYKARSEEKAKMEIVKGGKSGEVSGTESTQDTK